MLGRILDTMFAGEKRIKFIVPDGQNDRNWYTVANLGKKAKFLCFHGDQIRGKNTLVEVFAANKLMEDLTTQFVVTTIHQRQCISTIHVYGSMVLQKVIIRTHLNNWLAWEDHHSFVYL